MIEIRRIDSNWLGIFNEQSRRKVIEGSSAETFRTM